jgi:organic radical activating enzyme
VELVITTKCSLRCKHCAHLIPYYLAWNNGRDEKNLNTAELLKTIDHFFNAVDQVGVFRVLGGEPLLHPEMHIIVEKLKTIDKYQRLEVVTNGTIVPKGANLACLIPQKGKDTTIPVVRISNYGANSTRKEELLQCLESNSICYTIHDCMKNKWGDLGSPFSRVERNEKELYECYAKCTAKTIQLIFENKLFVCGRQPHLIKMGFSSQEDFFVDLESSAHSIRGRIKRLKSLKFLEACHFCNSRRAGGNFLEVEPAQQLSPQEAMELILNKT